VAVTNSVRLARTSDVDAIALVQQRAWRDAYAELMPPDALAALDIDELSLQWGRALLSSGQHRVFVAIAEGSGDVVGAASVGPTADPDLTEQRVGEVGALFVDPDHYRCGHGSRLMNACVDLLREGGYAECVTWLPLADEPRRAFFLSAGWGPDSAYRDLELPLGLEGGDAGPDAEPERIREVRLVTVLEP
jgi:GNAT superfamily N-acetyltransferase